MSENNIEREIVDSQQNNQEQNKEEMKEEEFTLTSFFIDALKTTFYTWGKTYF